MRKESPVDFNDVDKAVRQYWRGRSAAVSEANYEKLPLTSYDIFKVRLFFSESLFEMYSLQQCAYRAVQSKHYLDQSIAQSDLDAALIQWESVADEFGATFCLLLQTSPFAATLLEMSTSLADFDATYYGTLLP